MTETQKALQDCLQLFQLPPTVTVADWAEEHRYLSSESSSKRGKFRALPWQVAPMVDVTNPAVESITLMWAAQVGGKTEVINNTLCYFIDHDPCPMLMLQPTVEMGESWSKERLTPTLRDTPRLRGKVRDARSRDANNTILHKGFPGGHLTVVGTNAPAGLASRPIRVLLCDEVDKYPASAGVEGDPISLADKRTESFWDAVKVYTSTPTVKGVSRIESLFKLTDQNYFFVPCPRCKHFQALKWSGVRWPEGKPEEAYYACENCPEAWSDEERVAAITAGEWRPTAPFDRKRGYHLNGIYVLFKAQKGFRNRLHQMAAGFLEAKAGGRETLKTWTNTFLAETWEEPGDHPDPNPLLARCEVYSDSLLPEKVLVLVAGVDVQADRLEMETVGFGVGEESWGIRYDVFMGKPVLPAVWAQLDAALQREFAHPSGAKLRIVCACIDTGHLADEVYKFVRPRQDRMVFATKGSGVPASPLVSVGKKSGVRKVKLHMVGTDTAKGLIYSRLALAEPGPGYMHFPIGYTLQYFQGLTAERRVLEYRRGFPVHVWKCFPEGARNEPLDIRVGCLAALKIRNVTEWSFRELAKQMGGNKEKEEKKVEPEVTEATEEVAVVPVRRPVVRRKGWVNRW